MNTENEIYSLASCTASPKYSGDTITLRATPRDGIGPYYVAFKKDGIIIDPSRLGGSNPITDATEDVEITRTYTLNDEDVRNALTGTIDFSVFIRGSCPTGGGLQFDGVDDYVNTDSTNFPIGTNSRSMFAWFKTTIINGIIVDYGNAAPQQRSILMISGSKVAASQVGSNIAGTTNVNDGKWHYGGFTYDGTTYKVYLDGIQENDGTMSTNTVLNISRIGAGAYNPTAELFNGTIDEVRIYNRALSPTEILNNYNGYISRDGLVLEHIYSLGNANDLSGYGNNGTLVNGPVFIPNACMDTCTVAIGCIAPVCNFVVT